MPSQASQGLVQAFASTSKTMSPLPHREMRGNDGVTDDGRATEFAPRGGPGQAPGYSGPGVVIGLEVVNRRNRAAMPVCLLLAARMPRTS